MVNKQINIKDIAASIQGEVKESSKAEDKRQGSKDQKGSKTDTKSKTGK
jgi:hypothetical protein